MSDSSTTNSGATTALRVGIAGTLEFRDKDGNLIGTIEVAGSLPFTDADTAGDDDGLDDSSQHGS